MIKKKPKVSDNDFESEYDESEVIEKVKEVDDLDEISHDKYEDEESEIVED